MFRATFRVVFSRSSRRWCASQTVPTPKPRASFWDRVKGHLFPTLSEDAIREFQVLKKHTGHKATLGTIVALNIAVFLGWQVPSLYPYWEKYFVWKNDSLKKYEYWLLITPSFSHVEFSHLLANMSLLLYLGKRLHQFMGRRYFLALYFGAAIAGKIAANHEPMFRHDSNFWGRYANIIDGRDPNQQRALGASDAVCGLIAVWYLVFPRTPFHLFRRTHLLTEFLKARNLFPTFTRLLDKYSPSASSLWLIPILFAEDFLPALVPLPTNPHQPPHLVKAETSTSYFAHLGGALAGVMFHMSTTSKIKSQFFQFSWRELVNRCGHLVASLAFCSFISYKGISFAVGESQFFFKGAFVKAQARLDPLLRVSYVECSEGRDASVNSLVRAANTCAFDEAQELAERLRRLLDPSVNKALLPARGYVVHIEGSEYIAVPDSASELKYGRCDNHFLKLRAAKQLKEVDVSVHVATFTFEDPTLKKPKVLKASLRQGAFIQVLCLPDPEEDSLEARILRSFFSH